MKLLPVLILVFSLFLPIQAKSAAAPANQGPAVAPASGRIPPAPTPAGQAAPAATGQQHGQQGQTRTVTAEQLYASQLLAAEQGNVGAMLNLGSLYEQGIGTQKNFTRALQSYEKAAFAGSADGWYRVGNAFETGLGTTAEMSKAVEAYRKAADLGFTPAQVKLATLYLAGQGLPRDDNAGVNLLNKAATAGNSQASQLLGQISLLGLAGQKKDEAKAKQWFGKSAELGNLESMLQLAGMLREGKGGPANQAVAMQWYLVAKKSGLQNPQLEEVIRQIGEKLSKTQAAKAESDAEAWLKAYRQKAASK